MSGRSRARERRPDGAAPTFSLPPQRSAAAAAEPVGGRSLLALQAAAGNRAVSRLVRGGSSSPGISATPAASIQRCATDATCTRPDPCPVHATYSQKADPSRNAARGANDFVGQDAMQLQVAGKVPTKTQIRDGAATHEGIPSDMSQKVRDQTLTGGGVAAGIQSGARLPTNETLLVAPKAGAVVGAHSGFFPDNNGTSGQAPAHDHLRTLPNPQQDAAQQVLHTDGRLLATLPHGQQILGSSTFAGLTPTNAALKGPIENPSAAKQPNLIAMAQRMHAAREAHKDRNRAFALRYGHPSTASQSRDDIDDQGKGGQPLATDRAQSPVPPIADDPTAAAGGGNAVRFAANASSYLTAPHWPGYASARGEKQCKSCGRFSPPTARNCRNCHGLL